MQDLRLAFRALRATPVVTAFINAEPAAGCKGQWWRDYTALAEDHEPGFERPLDRSLANRGPLFISKEPFQFLVPVRRHDDRGLSRLGRLGHQEPPVGRNVHETKVCIAVVVDESTFEQHPRRLRAKLRRLRDDARRKELRSALEEDLFSISRPHRQASAVG